MTEVPEGQVPRNAAFWATYHAVQAEFADLRQKIECERNGHEIEYGPHIDTPRCRCGMTPEEIYTQYEARGMGYLERSEDGLTFHWGVRRS